MESFIIEGGHPLSGTITPQGAKNEALEVICATLLTTEPVAISNIPDILDVNNLIRTLASRCSVRSLARWCFRPTTSTLLICKVPSLSRSALPCVVAC